MEFKKNKKGQAAIEFLMTYGWMLLVVLIVGALIFSFVDFGSLLPNKVDMSSSSIRGDPASSSAFSSVATTDANRIFIGFGYTGATRVTMNVTKSSIETLLGDSCTAASLSNDITGIKANVTAGQQILVQFLRGQSGTVEFDCSGPGLIEGDVFEGTVTIGLTDATKSAATARVIPNSGSVRLNIQ